MRSRGIFLRGVQTLPYAQGVTDLETASTRVPGRSLGVLGRAQAKADDAGRLGLR